MVDVNISPLDAFKSSILNLDPVAFCENNLTLDGQQFRLTNNGYKPFADIYRYIGIKALEPDALPVILVKGRQVGATTMAAALACYFMASRLFGNNGRPPMRVIHLFPTLGMAAAYSKMKFSQMVGSAKPAPGEFKGNGAPKTYIEKELDTSSPANNNLHFKKFLGDNQLEIESTGPDGNRLRGRTTDCILADEVQDIPQIALGAITKTLTKAQYGKSAQGIQVYFGTPKQKGTAYYNMWMKSTQQYYHLKCEECESYFPLYRPDVEWESIWLYGYIVKCTECGHEQDKRVAAESGKWISFRADEEEAKYVGFHVNQLYMPDFTREMIDAQRPENNPINTERIYQNEVLGEFYDGEAATITKEEIHEKCSDKRKFARIITRIDNRKVYAGFDWGQRGNLDQLAGRQRGQSYSCAVILTAENKNLFHIQFATKMKSADPGHKVEVVEEMFRRYSINMAVGDIGDAHDLTHILQRKWPDTFLASRAAPNVNGHIKYEDEIFPKEIVFERNYYISELIGLLKNGNIKFPYGSYEKVMWLVEHCASMDVKVNINRSGDPVKTYIKGPTPNDGFMALLNAYIAYKFDITQGFQISHPKGLKFDNAKRNKGVPALLGYMPKWK